VTCRLTYHCFRIGIQPKRQRRSQRIILFMSLLFVSLLGWAGYVDPPLDCGVHIVVCSLHVTNRGAIFRHFSAFHLRSCHLRLTLGRASLCIHITVKGQIAEYSTVQYLDNMSHGQNLSLTSGRT
jgi:hypothetical protein